MVWVAAGLGIGHAAFSLYWALGGSWLLDTVGQWAVERQTQAPAQTAAVLLAVTALKLAAAVIPVAVDYGKLRARIFWRTIAWIGGVAIALYGASNTLVATAVLAGIVTPDGGYEPRAMIGHAFIWDPWFFFWGVALVLYLALTRAPKKQN